MSTEQETVEGAIGCAVIAASMAIGLCIGFLLAETVKLVILLLT
jgi:hypothetical protein